MRIDAVTPQLGTLRTEGATAPKPTATEAPQGISFSDLLDGAVTNASNAGHTAEAKAEAVASGALDDLHGTMIAAKEAEISLKLVGAIRNKLLDAFHEIWRTNV